MTKPKHNTQSSQLAQQRVQRSAEPEIRGDRGVTEDANRDGTGALTDEEFDALMNTSFDDSVLPRPPETPGWHYCWLTTTSQYDTIQKRLRLGYELVRHVDLPKFDPANGKSLTGFEGVIACNEMVLSRIHETRYQRLMNHYHHAKPLEEEGVILDNINEEVKRAEAKGAKVTKSDGVTDMEESVRRDKRHTPVFS